MTEVLKAGVLSDEIDLGALAHNAAEQAEEFVRKVSTITNDFNICLIFEKSKSTIILLAFSFDRYGKHRGKCAIIVIYPHGCKTIISYIATIGHRCHHSGRASSLCSGYTRKPVTFGHICLAALRSLVLPHIS